MGQQGLEQKRIARARRKGVLSRTCACVALATGPAIGLGHAADAATFKGGVVLLGAAAPSATGGNLTFHDVHPVPPPPPPLHPDPHPVPPPPPPPHPDPHPVPPPPPSPDHHPPPSPPPAPHGTAQVPRDEIVPWFLNDDSEEEEKEDVIDLSQLQGDEVLDGGVTSGSDPSVWETIRVEHDD